MANKKTSRTYRRLLTRTVIEIQNLKPGNPQRMALLNKRMKKYADKLQRYGTTGNNNNRTA